MNANRHEVSAAGLGLPIGDQRPPLQEVIRVDQDGFVIVGASHAVIPKILPPRRGGRCFTRHDKVSEGWLIRSRNVV